MKSLLRWAALLIVAALWSIGGVAQESTTLKVVTYDSFTISEEVLAAFEAQTGISVEIVRLADAGAMVNQAVLTAITRSAMCCTESTTRSCRVGWRTICSWRMSRRCWMLSPMRLSWTPNTV